MIVWQKKMLVCLVPWLYSRVSPFRDSGRKKYEAARSLTYSFQLKKAVTVILNEVSHSFCLLKYSDLP